MEMRVKQRSRFNCTFCGRPAYFFSHSGLLCRNDALLDAVLNGWMPAPIDQGKPIDPNAGERQVA
jgi:hypothetical protein